ncbi:MAG: hypothetical protein ACW99A_21855 [Candidatus Kariarchaeaceae archaeon]|jgi:hypothetical protein
MRVIDGTPDVEGLSNDENGILIYEFRKPMKSNDTKGYDISLSDGDDYYVMLAIWDNKYIHSAAESVNIQRGNSQFYQLTVGGSRSSESDEIIIVLAILGVFGVLAILFYIKKNKAMKPH